MGIQKLKNSVIKSIQRGTVSLNAVNNVTVNISSVDMTKSFLSVNGTGIISITNPVLSRTFQIVFLSNSQIQISAQLGTGTTATGTAAWQVIEYR
jgi:hypothetical protein